MTSMRTDRRVSERTAGWAGIVGPLLFLSAIAGLSLVNGHVDVSGHQLERFGLLMYVGFLGFGLLTVVFALGIRTALPPGRWASTARGLLLAFAVGPLLGTFTMGSESGPPKSWHAAAHFAGFLLVVLVPLVAVPVFARAVWGDPRWHGLGWGSLFVAVVNPVLVFSPVSLSRAMRSGRVPGRSPT